MTKFRHPQQILAAYEELKRVRCGDQPLLTVCGGTGCRACGAEELFFAFQEGLARRGLAGEMGLKWVGCVGLCELGPIVVVQPEGIFYPRLRPEDAGQVVEAAHKGSVAERLLYRDQRGEPIAREGGIPFYKKQKRLVLAGNGQIDPLCISDYLAFGGYQALVKALGMLPEEVIEEIQRSGLRGRGGAGFPTGPKWEFCRKAPGRKKYVIGNGDEGDPGAYMDRSLMEGNPHAVIEGMLIGAYAVGADEGYLYVRAEYSLAVKHLRLAMAQAEERGLLGKNILGTGFSFHLRVFQGAGAFVCGEKTALLASIAGKRGQPRPRPPFPAQAGLWGKPTLINNVEAWANVPLILKNGADWFRSFGTEKSPGTKIFSLTGDVKNSGLVEVPMGITLRELIQEIGGGARPGKCKAAQIGGPSGGCVPEELFDTPVDFDSLQSIGAMMGSGGLVVLAETACIVDTARFFLEFTPAESCGQCPPCRIGTKRMLEILTRITAGRGRPQDLLLLEELAWGIRQASLCGLGQTAPNPVLTTLRYFHKEYEAHVEGGCPAGACRALIAYTITAERWVGCGLCVQVCPQGAIWGERGKPHRILVERCLRCGLCASTCPKGAITKREARPSSART